MKKPMLTSLTVFFCSSLLLGSCSKSAIDDPAPSGPGGDIPIDLPDPNLPGWYLGD